MISFVLIIFKTKLYSMDAQRFQWLIYLHLFTDCFMEISLKPLEQIQFCNLPPVDI